MQYVTASHYEAILYKITLDRKQLNKKASIISLLGALCSLLELDELQDTVLHLLDSLVLSETHTTLVGDVVDTALSLGVLATGSAYLEVVLGGDLLKLSLVGGQLGDLDVD